MKPSIGLICLILTAGALRHAESATITTEVRRQLLEKAQDWLVPQPKPEAKLIKVSVFRSDKQDFYALGFIEPGSPKKVLVGFQNVDTEWRDTKDVPDASQLALDDISPTSPFDAAHGVNFGLVTGIQLLRRGNEKLGTALIGKALDAEAGHARSPFRSPAGEEPVLMLARSCLAAALNEITSPKPDFPKVKERIERLIADQPMLRSEATDWVLVSLKASVAHKPAPDGTVEQIVDDFLLGGATHGALVFGAGKFGLAQRALILKGFDAVPALLKERHSVRFTNHLMQGFNNFVSYPMSAGQVVDAYLQRLANNELELNWLDRQQGFVADDNAVIEWWKTASALGEATYVKQNTVILGKENNARLSYVLLLLARERYPALLPDFYRTLLKTSLASWPVMEAIVDSKTVPREELIQLMEDGIATNSEAHRNSALGDLQDLSPALADKHLLRLLKDAPTTASGEYWTDQDANLGRFVSKSGNQDVWQALHALIDRADLGMRMELIHNLLPPHEAPHGILASFQEIFDRFSEDETIRDTANSTKFDGPGAGFPHDQIAMRDFIHEHWASWLKLKLEPPEEGADADDWKAYREAVGLALKDSIGNKGLKKNGD